MHTAHIAIDPQTKACRLQTCTEHSRSVACLAKSILAPCGLGSAGYLACLLHDCGKFTDAFDAYIIKASNNEPVRKGSVIHTFAEVIRAAVGDSVPVLEHHSNLVKEGITPEERYLDFLCQKQTSRARASSYVLQQKERRAIPSLF